MSSTITVLFMTIRYNIAYCRSDDRLFIHSTVLSGRYGNDSTVTVVKFFLSFLCCFCRIVIPLVCVFVLCGAIVP